MDEAKGTLVRGWAAKARSDLATARKLATGPDPYLDTAVFHCQQAAEKILKGFLVLHDVRFEKTHDLEVLLGLAGRVASGLNSLLDAADRLTPYAVAYRYPGDMLAPAPEEFAAALAAAEGIVAEVQSLMPAELRQP
jgi:HEPN domain-containing protein